jgi:hypothetical protein
MEKIMSVDKEISTIDEVSELGKSDLEPIANRFDLKGGIPETESAAFIDMMQACRDYVDGNNSGNNEKTISAIKKLRIMFINPDEEKLKGFANIVGESL